MFFQANQRILFIGDSITDSGRRLRDPEGIGFGYVRMIRDHLNRQFPELALEVINKGVSANRVTDLTERWEEDVIAHSPDWVSVSIGINDVWRQLDNPDIEQVYPEQFEEVYSGLLFQVKETCNAQLILMEPTVILENASSEGNQKLLPYVEIVHKLSEQFQTILVPTHQAFLHHIQTKSHIPLTTDGVHMTVQGNELMAANWLKELMAT